jgi:hypothetical protein
MIYRVCCFAGTKFTRGHRYYMQFWGETDKMEGEADQCPALFSPASTSIGKIFSFGGNGQVA